MWHCEGASTLSQFLLILVDWNIWLDRIIKVEWQVAQLVHLYQLDFPSINSIRQADISIYFSYQIWKNCTNTSNCVILSIYIHTRCHMIGWMSYILLMKTDNKPDMIDISINRCQQKYSFNKNWVIVYIYSIFVIRQSQVVLIDKNWVSVDMPEEVVSNIFLEMKFWFPIQRTIALSTTLWMNTVLTMSVLYLTESADSGEERSAHTDWSNATCISSKIVSLSSREYDGVFRTSNDLNAQLLSNNVANIETSQSS